MGLETVKKLPLTKALEVAGSRHFADHLHHFLGVSAQCTLSRDCILSSTVGCSLCDTSPRVDMSTAFSKSDLNSDESRHTAFGPTKIK